MGKDKKKVEPPVTKKSRKAPKISLQTDSWDSKLQNPKDNMGEAEILEKEGSKKAATDEISPVQLNSPQSKKKASMEKEGAHESVHEPHVSSAPEPQVPEVLGEKSAQTDCGPSSVLDVLNISSDDVVTCEPSVDDHQKPLHKRLNEVAEEAEEREPDSMEDDLPLIVF